jgi:hypothetical protein
LLLLFAVVVVAVAVVAAAVVVVAAAANVGSEDSIYKSGVIHSVNYFQTYSKRPSKHCRLAFPQPFAWNTNC